MSTYTDASLIITPNAKKASKLYALKGADLDVVRATTATYVGSDGLIKTALANVPRLDYTNASCPSILIEPQRTNSLTWSDDFNNVIWLKSNVSINENVSASPTGMSSADRMTGNGFSDEHRLVFFNNSFTSGTTYTLSVFIKKDTNDFMQLALGGSAFPSLPFANYDINSGILGTKGGGVTSTISSIGNGWYRCAITAIANTTVADFLYINLVTSSSAARRELNTLSTSVFIWGAQLEVGSNATSYIPTTTSTVTRNADVISKTGLSGITSITETFENGTTNIISGSPTSYTMSQGRIKQVIGL